ncbi:MAG: helix-turn-helix transcriptional regulator [Propionibacteriaceae bacterium]|jgi:transcriptional regulator with XRE-family HTH domain|nr:helix-turn-helix transcriptional regulator [Propionibacteriaceae bacterium]
MESLETAIRDAMRESAVTQVELSALTGVSQGRISYYLAGKAGMSQEMARMLLSALGFEAHFEVRAMVPVFTKAEKRSWALHRQISRKLDEAALQAWEGKVSSNLAKLEQHNRGEPHLSRVARWKALIQARDVKRIRIALLDVGTYGKQMREVSPFAGILSESERLQVLESLK